MALSTPGRVQSRAALLDQSIPPILRPVLRAYVLGYASAVAPRLLTLILQYVAKWRRSRGKGLQNGNIQPQDSSFVESLRHILCGGLDPQRFPTFCAALVGGTTLFDVLMKRLINRFQDQLSITVRRRLSIWVSSFIAGWLSLRLLQSKNTKTFTETKTIDGGKEETVQYAGRTLDLTFFAATRAVDVVVGELWSQRRKRRAASGKQSWSDLFLSKMADPSIFAASCALIMWAWFYSPCALPRSYNKWISSAAAVDARLIEALRRCRKAELRYGEDTGQAPLLQSMCADYGWPARWGDPAVTSPFPCEMVHMGSGASCERHALARLARSFKWAMATYLPLNLLARRARDPKSLRRALASAARSSSFLAAFIALFYYGVCLARTRVGPRVLGRTTASRQSIDAGLCVACGCFLCGWSIFFESPDRRKDMALFVAPRALATLFPRRYPLDKQWRETFVFAFSTAVVFTCVRENRNRVRGVLGSVLGSVLKA